MGLTGELPSWPVPKVGQVDPTSADLEAAAMIHERYSAIVRDHYAAL